MTLIRYKLDHALKRAGCLENPLDRRTREGRMFDSLLAALTREQGEEAFAALSPMRQLLTFRFVMVHLRLATDDAALATDGHLSEHATDRHIAYLNVLTRLAHALGVSVRAGTPDADALLAELSRGRGRPRGR